MENLAELLEEELAEAFEVKNRKSLHRYVLLLTRQYVEREAHECSYSALREDIRDLISSMERGFKRVDERFEEMQKQSDSRFDQMTQHIEALNVEMDKRFEAQQMQMDKRFEAQQMQMDKRFEAQQMQMDKRFEAQQTQMDSRFDLVDKRFEEMHARFSGVQKLIGIGFTALALIIAAFNAAILFSG